MYSDSLGLARLGLRFLDALEDHRFGNTREERKYIIQNFHPRVESKLKFP